MNSIAIQSERIYEVTFVSQWVEEVERFCGGRRIVVLAPEKLAEQIRKVWSSAEMISLPEGESQKSIGTYAATIEELAERKIERDAIVVGVGGGATTDLVGFVASSYLRGIEWVAVPTSVVGMVDAAIGGKTAINLAHGKNLAGAFYSPSRVIVDFSWLTSLDPRDKNAGLVEAAKCGFISDPTILELIRAPHSLDEVIYRSVSVKAGIVSKDFRESDIREYLNYGHTLGHAVEKHSNYSLRHGEAVAVGLLYAAQLAQRLGFIDKDLVDLHQSILENLGMNLHYPGDAWRTLEDLMSHDKKRRSSQNAFILLKNLAEPHRVEGLSSELLSAVYFESIGKR